MLQQGDNIRSLVKCPSLSGVMYQAHVLIQQLKLINDEDYPIQACRIRNLFQAYTEYILRQLESLHNPENPLEPKGGPGFNRIRAFAECLRPLYSFVRYLRASAANQAPPGLQVALTQLTDLHFPSTENGNPACLIRPQWKYNLTCIYLNSVLTRAIPYMVLDRDGELGITNAKDTLKSVWNWWVSNRKDEDDERSKDKDREFPAQIAILSFAGLDTHDVLLYPLLGHELGHFIDFSYDPQLYLREPLRIKSETRREEVLRVLRESFGGTVTEKEADKHCESVLSKAQFCIRELLADLIAVRMLGFSFFTAQAEFLKTLASWSQPTITSNDYPGIKFRLRVAFDHLFQDGHSGNIQTFLKQHQKEGKYVDVATWLLEYLEQWRTTLDSVPEPLSAGEPDPKEANLIDKMVSELAEKAVRASLPDIKAVACQVIPDTRCARLSHLFFERIHRLTQDLPPSCPKEGPDSFAEIMSAAWAYQLKFGEANESKRRGFQEKFDEYEKTCHLVLKAIELIPPPRNHGKVTNVATEGTEHVNGP